MPKWTSMLALAALAALACQRQGAEQGAPLPPADHVYEVQGVVEQLPDPAGAAWEIVIHHQAIPEFVSREGQVVGMSSMTMPFAVARSVDLSTVEAGDPVHFRFEVRWSGEPVTLVTAVEELPAGTEIDFERTVTEETDDGELSEPEP